MSDTRNGTTSDMAAELFQLAKTRGAEPFRDDGGRLYVSVPVNGHHEHYPLSRRSPAVRSWLKRLAFDATARLAKDDLVNQLLEQLEAAAQFNGPVCETFVRIAPHDGTIYLDLGESEWQAIRITPTGWEPVRNPPVKFRRPRGLLTLPVPRKGGSVRDLAPFLNVKAESDHFILIVAWIIAALRGRGPYPILSLQGEQGSAKSTTARVCRRLIDPNAADLRSDPHEIRDLMIAANNGHIISIDNVSSIRPWQSDAYCRLSTGGGFGTRELYADTDEILIDAQRPLTINSIVDVFERPDLLDRAIVIRLDGLADTQRRTEADFWPAFDDARPRILGALLDAVSVALRDESTTRLTRLPRMADFARWVSAAEAALSWTRGRFLEAYEANRARAVVALLDDDPVALAIRKLLDNFDAYWDGTATELLERLKHRDAFPKWKQDPRKATAALKRLVPALRTLGIETDTVEKHGGKKLIRLWGFER